jgi:hypothetical protein
MNLNPAVSPRASRLSIGVVMLLVSGIAIGVWLAGDLLKEEFTRGRTTNEPVTAHAGFGWADWTLAVVAGSLLGGLSLIGPPLLLITGCKRQWGSGRTLWFSYGIATWVLWTPVVFLKAIGDHQPPWNRGGEDVMLALPSVASVLTMPAMVASGALRRSRRRRFFQSWQERFGVALGVGWTCLGLYWIVWIYLWLLS